VKQAFSSALIMYITLESIPGTNQYWAASRVKFLAQRFYGSLWKVWTHARQAQL